MKVKPTHDMVFVRILKAGKTKAGLHLPDTAQARDRAVVLDVGPGRVLDSGVRVPPCCQPGDEILIRHGVPMFGVYGLEDHFLIPDNGIIGIDVEPDATGLLTVPVLQ